MNWIRGITQNERETARLQSRIVHFALLGVLITGIAVGLATALPAYKDAREAVEASADFQVRLQAMVLRQYLTRLNDMAMQVASRSAIRDKLEEYNKGRIKLTELQTFSASKLEEAMRQHPDAIGITRLDANNGRVVQIGIAAPDGQPIPLADSRKPILSVPMVGDRESFVVVSAPITNGKGERVGTDLVVFRTAGLAALLRGLEEVQGSRALFAARDGRIWHTDGAEQLVLAKPTPLLQAAVTGAIGGTHGLLHGNESDVVLFAPVSSDWAIAVTVPSLRLYSHALHEIAAPVVAVLMMLLFASIGMNRLLKPIAERSVKLARQLRETAEEQRSLLEYARSFLFRTDGAGNIAFISPSIDDVLGFAPEELPQDLIAMLAGVALRGAKPGEEIPPRLLRVRDSEGANVTLEINARVYSAEDGTSGIFGVARDVSERVRAEEALRAGEERLRTLINAGPDFICFKDGEGRWQEVNSAGLALFAIDPARYRGLTDAQLAVSLPPVQGGALLRMAQADVAAWSARMPLRLEERIAAPGGERIFDLIRVPLFDSDAQRSALVVLGRDVTEHRRAERELARTTAEWTYAMDFVEDALFLTDLEGRVLRANHASYALTGRAPDQMIGQPIGRLFHPHQGADDCRICKSLNERHDAFITLEVDDGDNQLRRPAEVMIKMIPDGDGVPVRMLMVVHDLTRVRRTEEELRLAASVFQGTHEGVVITDAQKRILRVNSAFTRIMGFAASEVNAIPMQEVLWARKSEENRYQYLWDTIDSQGLWHGEEWYRRKNGEMFPVWHRISAVRSEGGDLLHYINTFTDISDKKLSEERIHHLAHYDVLTDLPNRLLFNDRFNHSTERAQRANTKLALLFIDLDRFKNVNDTLGHHVGDELLRVVGTRLRHSVREQDTVARLGGDEFAVVLEEISRVQDAGLVAQKILDAIGKPITIEDHELFVGGSIGISLFPDDGREVQTLLRNADAAMYRAKEQGRNTYEFYTPELTTASIERLDLENSLRRALERGELQLYYQPQVLTTTGRIVGAEALLRWVHPVKGMVSPSVFVPLAEDSGLMGQIGAWVIETACNQMREWQAAGLRPGRIAVNLSGQQIIRGDLVETVSKILERTGIDPIDLELEITESFVMTHLADGVDVLNGLKRLGVTLAIDDFGTGYSSLAYLKRLPIDRLKIDRSFVQDIPANRDDMAIAATIIAMGHSLDLEVIAEGVEQPAQMDFLRRHQCDELQGYLFSKPVPANEYAMLLKRVTKHMNGEKMG